MLEFILSILIILAIILRMAGLIQFFRKKLNSFTMHFLPMRNQTLKDIRREPELVSTKAVNIMVIASIADLILWLVFLYVILDRNTMMIVLIFMIFVVSDNVIRGKIDQEINK